jgi:hypothetical protein
MRKFMWLVLVCAAPVYGQTAAPDFRTGAGCGPQETQFNVKLDAPDKGVLATSPGKARVYVIQIVGTNDKGITTRVGIDGTWVGANSGTGYNTFEVDPGDHNICADWQSSQRARQLDGAAIAIRAEQGKTYFFVIGLQVAALDFNLTEVDPAEGQWLLSISQKSNWTQKK